MTQSMAESNWTPRNLRKSSKGGQSDTSRVAKREQLGNRRDRNIYKHPHAHKLWPDQYARLCEKANRINR